MNIVRLFLLAAVAFAIMGFPLTRIVTASDTDCLLNRPLARASMNGCDLRKADLTFANLRQIDLRNARLGDADLRFAILVGAKINDAPVEDLLAAFLTDVFGPERRRTSRDA